MEFDIKFHSSSKYLGNAHAARTSCSGHGQGNCGAFLPQMKKKGSKDKESDTTDSDL